MCINGTDVNCSVQLYMKRLDASAWKTWNGSHLVLELIYTSALGASGAAEGTQALPGDLSNSLQAETNRIMIKENGRGRELVGGEGYFRSPECSIGARPELSSGRAALRKVVWATRRGVHCLARMFGHR